MSLGDVRQASLVGLQETIASEPDLLALSKEQAWLHVVEVAGDLARAIRTGRIDLLGEGTLLGAPLLSVLRFAELAGFNLADATWEKFPAVCPFCVLMRNDVAVLARQPGESRARGGLGVLHPCACGAPPKPRPFDPDEPGLADFRARTDLRPTAVREWQAMFSDLYSHKHFEIQQHRDLHKLAYHFNEEIGEVAKELRKGDLRACSYEAADVVSWILSLANSASRTLKSDVDVAAQVAGALDGVRRDRWG